MPRQCAGLSFSLSCQGDHDGSSLVRFPAAGAAGAAICPETAGAETLPQLASGVFKPAAASGIGPRISQEFALGMLKAGNIRLEMHETTQQVGAPHEAIGTHLHNEIWMVREGIVELMTNGVTCIIKAGDVRLCVAGDEHWTRNAGDTVATYFVLAAGPPE